MSSEIWKAIPGYEGAYEVSNLGRVRSRDRLVRVGHGAFRTLRGRVLRPAPGRTGLCVVVGKGNTRQVHSLVAAAFIGPRPPAADVRHLDGDPTNNCATNLAYGTRSENNRDVVYHGRRRLSVEQVRQLRARAAFGFAYGERYQIALAWGVNPGTVYHALSGKQYSHVS